jgi:nitrate reductase NapAB chaperone NapD
MNHKSNHVAAQLHIASCVVRYEFKAHESILSYLSQFDDVSIYSDDRSTALVVIIESVKVSSMLDRIDQIRSVNGVWSVDLVYQHAESITVMSEELL